MPIDPKSIKLGKQAPLRDHRNLQLASYLNNVQLPAIPSQLSWYHTPETKPGFAWRMFLNDSLGDCAIAGPAHIEMLWTYNVNQLPFVPTDQDVLAGYELVGGYQPNQPNTDNGCILLNVLKTWQNTGLFGHKINAFVEVNPRNLQHVKTAVALFGAVDVGLAMPLSWQSQVGQSWTVVDPNLQNDSLPGSWGGHCVIIGKYDDVAQEFTCITWGQEQRISYNAFATYCDEVYAPLSTDWANSQGLSPAGVNFSSLDLDLNAVKN